MVKLVVTFDISLVTDRDVRRDMERKVNAWTDRKPFEISHAFDKSTLRVSYHGGTMEQHDRATLGLKGIIKRAKALNRAFQSPPPITITNEEAKALVRAFRSVVGQNTENPNVEAVKIYAMDVRVLERAALRLRSKI